MITKLAEKHDEKLYALFRIFVGLLFLQHGLQKLFGIFTDNNPVILLSLMGLAGIIEFGGGILITLGLFTRPIAILGAIEMVSAFFIAHYPRGIVPIENGGELALLYFTAFLVLIAHGSRKWSLDKYFSKGN